MPLPDEKPSKKPLPPSLPSAPSAQPKNKIDTQNILERSKKKVEEIKTAKEVQWDTKWGKDPEWRLNTKFRKVGRTLTNIEGLDTIFKGLPKGATIFYGKTGTGKSKLARLIASKCNGKVVLFLTESPDDFPFDENGMEYEHIQVIDYRLFLPDALKVEKEILYFIRKFKPKIAIIDSVTALLSNTKKAVAEADVRTPVWNIAKEIEQLNLKGELECSLIGISQTRGDSAYIHPAGGDSILFAGSMIVFFERKLMEATWDEKTYGLPKGTVVYLMTVIKDRQGCAKQGSQYVIEYKINNDKKIIPIFKQVSSSLND